MSRSRTDAVLLAALRGAAAAAGAITVLIAAFLIIEAWPAFFEIGPPRFFTDPSWHPAEGRFNLLPMIWGTVAVTAGSVLVATPLGLLSAIFCHFYAPGAIAAGYRRLVELLAGIPSVVYGFWGLVVLVPLIARVGGHGQSVAAGILILTLMVLPTVALTADAALTAVPRQHLVTAAALGMSRWTTIRGVALPAARSGLVTGVILETGRAIGETMAVLMVCGNVVQVPGSLFDPIRTLTANIALEMAYALGRHRSALFVSGLILLLMVASLVLAAERVMTGRRRVRG